MNHRAATEESSSDSKDETKVKSRRPINSNFRSQNLPACKTGSFIIIPIFIVIGILFIPIGILLFYFSSQINEKIIDYTNCEKFDAISGLNLGITCEEILRENPQEPCECRIEFDLSSSFDGEVLVYYGLQNFYQNHRRYVISRDDSQLGGDVSSASKDCSPLQSRSLFDEDFPVVPCGLIANSIFNDTFNIQSHYKTGRFIPMRRTNIAWETDKVIRFRNPSTENQTIEELQEAFRSTLRPEWWSRDLWELDQENENNNGLQNEDLIVWMRVSALPNFRKLHRRIDGGLAQGYYTLFINYAFPVMQFGGTKTFILSERSILGGRNNFIGITYIAVGSTCLLLGILLLIIYLKVKVYSKK